MVSLTERGDLGVGTGLLSTELVARVTEGIIYQFSDHDLDNRRLIGSARRRRMDVEPNVDKDCAIL